MGVAILDTDAPRPDCGHHGAWAQTLSNEPQRAEGFRCEACETEWRTSR
jgi:DNA-directed RNA polymerase subunit M/transcription elongation factor TFIIS